MILDALRQSEDPGISCTAQRLAAGGAIDTPVRRRDPRPERIFKICWYCFWIAIALTALARLVAG